MKIWFTDNPLEQINDFRKNTMVDHLGITFTEIGDDYLKATMPVNSKTIQPQGLLHGGASVALAETLGSVASWFVGDPKKMKGAVGVEINANHLSSAKEGDLITGIVRPIKLGKTLHVWEIKMYNKAEKLCCISRFTAMLLMK